MWKESYRLGVDAIDRQHIELFDMTENFMKTIKKPNTEERKKECREAITFLKRYALEHFTDEEEYQKSIQYVGFTEHRQLHQEFVLNVLKHENKMLSSDFDIADIEDFAGMLMAWLAYHVADADQKIVKAENPQEIVMKCLYTAICYSLNKMTRLNKKDIVGVDNQDDFNGDLAISIGLTGDVTATIEYVYTEEFILKLLKSFLFMNPKSLDSLACSVLIEITNLITKNTIIELSKDSVCCNIEFTTIKSTPPFSALTDFFILNTGMGKLKAGICT